MIMLTELWTEYYMYLLLRKVYLIKADPPGKCSWNRIIEIAVEVYRGFVLYGVDAYGLDRLSNCGTVFFDTIVT